MCLSCTTSIQLYWWHALIILHTFGYGQSEHVPRLYTTNTFWGLADTALSRMGRIILNTFVSLMLGEGGGGGGYKIRIFCSAWLGNLRDVFVIIVIQSLKKGVHKDFLTDYQRDSSKPYILITFYLMPLQSRIVWFFLSSRKLVIFLTFASITLFYIYFVRFQLPTSITSFLCCFSHSQCSMTIQLYNSKSHPAWKICTLDLMIFVGFYSFMILSIACGIGTVFSCDENWEIC